MTKEKFEAYVKVQMSGRYNLVIDAHRAAAEAGLSLDDYMYIICHYTELKAKHAA